jgi:hypothetical protein
VKDISPHEFWAKPGKNSPDKLVKESSKADLPEAKKHSSYAQSSKE